MKHKKIEVLMATYNGAAYIREQLDSILAQTCGDWILTISDDGSTDGTEAIVDEYVRRTPEKIRRVYAGRRFGNAKEHFMWLIGQCDAEWIMLSDQDDTVKEWKFEKMSALMAETEAEAGMNTPILIFSDQTPTDAQLHPICDSLMSMQKQFADVIDWRMLVFQNIVTGGACMFNQALARLACQCRDVSQIIMHDWWLGIVAARFGTVVYLDESTGYYRQHGGNSVGAKDVGSIGHIAYKLRHLYELKGTICLKKAQAAMLQKTFGARLAEEDEQFISQFSRQRSGALFYLKYRKYIHTFFRLAGMMALG